MITDRNTTENVFMFLVSRLDYLVNLKIKRTLFCDSINYRPIQKTFI
jgi:hypothetical protein